MYVHVHVLLIFVSLTRRYRKEFAPGHEDHVKQLVQSNCHLNIEVIVPTHSVHSASTMLILHADTPLTYIDRGQKNK